jgi:hypothetical protein
MIASAICKSRSRARTIDEGVPPTPSQIGTGLYVVRNYIGPDLNFVRCLSGHPMSASYCCAKEHDLEFFFQKHLITPLLLSKRRNGPASITRLTGVFHRRFTDEVRSFTLASYALTPLGWASHCRCSRDAFWQAASSAYALRVPAEICSDSTRWGSDHDGKLLLFLTCKSIITSRNSRRL